LRRRAQSAAEPALDPFLLLAVSPRARPPPAQAGEQAKQKEAETLVA